MWYTNPLNAYPDLNYFQAPFCILNPLFPSIPQSQNGWIYHPHIFAPQTQVPCLLPNYVNPQFPFTYGQFYVPGPKNGNVVNTTSKPESNVIDNKTTPQPNSQTKELFHIRSSPNTSPSSCRTPPLSPKKTLQNEPQTIPSFITSTTQELKKQEEMISDKIITEFNTNPKLKKIHSTYHLKRKISTKFQNDLKETINRLISKVNLTAGTRDKIPYIVPNSKSFREDVKIESLKKYRNIKIGKYISEDVNSEDETSCASSSYNNSKFAGRSLNMDNFAVIDKIDKIYHANTGDTAVKELHTLWNETVVGEYYKNFLNCERYKKCFKKDLEKYSNKLKKMKGVKIDLYKKMFKEKYEGIARNYFACE